MQEKPVARRLEAAIRAAGHSRKEAERMISDLRAHYLAEIAEESAPEASDMLTEAEALTSILH